MPFNAKVQSPLSVRSRLGLLILLNIEEGIFEIQTTSILLLWSWGLWLQACELLCGRVQEEAQGYQRQCLVEDCSEKPKRSVSSIRQQLLRLILSIKDQLLGYHYEGNAWGIEHESVQKV